VRLLQGAVLVVLVGLIVSAAVAQDAVERGDAAKLQAAAMATIGGDVEVLGPPLPRWREGGTPYDPKQSLYPFAIKAERSIPTSGLMASPAEYEPVRGVLFYYASNMWPTVVRDLVVGLTADPDHDDIAYVVVPNSYQQTHAINTFVAGGADMSRVEFITQIGNALWIRDYGPHYIFQDGALGIVDSHYYPTRPLDNFIPTAIGDDYFIMPTYDMGLYYSGGNFQPGPNHSAVMSSLVNADRPASQGCTPDLIADLFGRYQGIDTLHIFPQLPYSVDGTGHIDMWMYLVDEDDVIISEFKPGSNPTAISITNNAVPYMENLGFTVHRAPAWNAMLQGYMTNFTYTNAFRVNDRIFIPTYGQGNAAYLDEDAAALAAWQAAAGPDVEIIEINCYDIIWAAGAIHCIVMQVPRCVDPVPAVHVIWPDGGELLAAGTTRTIEWVATDTDNAEIPQIDLYYTIYDGDTFEHIATTTDTGHFDWLVPDIAAPEVKIKVVATASDLDQGDIAAPEVKIKVVATASDLDQGEGLSADFLQIARADQSVLDFKAGGGADKFGWGHQTPSWSSVTGNRTPVTTELPDLLADAYARLAYSDATGGDSDPNRYISPYLTSGYESTHVYEFTVDEDPANIDDITILWEGYADQCTQAELYVWDYDQGQWGDGTGLFDQNRYMDCWAGNRDGYLRGSLRTDFDRYLDANGVLTMLVYAERRNDETYHDYMSVTVTTVTQSMAGDLNCDNLVDFGDINPFVQALTNPAGWQAEYPGCPIRNGDINWDGMTDFGDINPFVRLLTQ